MDFAFAVIYKVEMIWNISLFRKLGLESPLLHSTYILIVLWESVQFKHLLLPILKIYLPIEAFLVELFKFMP